MQELIFIGVLGGALAALYVWAFRTLPGARWQFAAAVPVAALPDGGWRGLNLTWYGVFYALGIAVSSALGFVLLKSIGAPTLPVLLLLVGTVAVCMPAARFLAGIIERKKGTQSVAAGFFTGMVLVPPALLLMNALVDSVNLPPLATLAAFGAAYALGEGIGRLSCISFGCCYGRRVVDLGAGLRRLVAPFAVRFRGPTKKIAYASGWEGVAVVPIQAVTATLYTAVALGAAWLFLAGEYGAALLLSIGFTQVWRVASEFLRADYRGGRKFTVYQWMSLSGVAYVAAWVAVLPREADMVRADIAQGLAALWTAPGVIAVQALWLAAFLYAGRSTVTGSTLRFHVVDEHRKSFAAQPPRSAPRRKAPKAKALAGA
ncbi:MAG: prolipoprotein diacylglyceryl transferase [Candidatus Sumerlaeia bacterium]|nr:prolipoprotein diacylglyceryl transferase [Candidatus Sumerlaeia bacterium]